MSDVLDARAPSRAATLRRGRRSPRSLGAAGWWLFVAVFSGCGGADPERTDAILDVGQDTRGDAVADAATPSDTAQDAGADATSDTTLADAAQDTTPVEDVPDACVPDCDGRSCGPDGCGGSCEPGCGLGQECDASGRCRIDCVSGCEAEDAFNAYVEQFHADGGHLATDVHRIPTVVHVIYDDEADRLSLARVESQIAAMTSHFRRQHESASETREPFREVAADTHIAFCLAGRDPSGAEHPGVLWHHVPGYRTEHLAELMADTQWAPSRYMNVWVTPQGEGGSSTMPWEAGTATDGFWVGARQFGTIGADLKEGFEGGNTATHEAGHYLGLYHTFHASFMYLGQCDFPDCATTGDRVCDTPLDWQLAWTAEQCEDGQRFCDEGPPFFTQSENFMAYGYDDCTNMFSYGQRTRMRAALAGRRASLVSVDNLEATGCAP